MKVIKHIIYDVFRLIRKSEFLFLIYNFLFVPIRFRKFIVQKDYDLCIYAYPSSANSYIKYYIRYAFDDSVKISHHMHSSAMITRAIRYRKPIVILLRDPLEAVASYYCRFSLGNTFSLNTAIKTYNDFYRRVLKHIDATTLYEFEYAIHNPDIILRSLSDEIKIAVKNKSALKKEKKYIDFVKERLNSDTIKRTGKETTSLPSAEIQELKSNVYTLIKENRHFETSEQLYHALLKYSIK